MEHGTIRHLSLPANRCDRIRGPGQVLVYRDDGRDITRRRQAASFSRAPVERRFEQVFLGAGCGVVIAAA